ncbi:MAG: 30S ribosomal protein S21 [Myxococcota bacterium]
MAQILVRDGENLDKALRRFKKKVEASGILKDIRGREHYLKPSIRKKRSSALRLSVVVAPQCEPHNVSNNTSSLVNTKFIGHRYGCVGL